MKINKIKYLRIRLTESEYKEIDKCVAKTFFSRSEFLRRLIFDRLKTVETKESYRLREALLLQIGQINNNVNQVAKALNAMAKHGEPVSFTSFQAENIQHLNRLIDSWMKMKSDLLKEL